ncbi:MAG: toll/interleukin-1 receptor domain-containing protein [Thermodesulfobacteriota bacterium]
MATEKTYKAFISYKHHISTTFAEKFELHLKRYAKEPLSLPTRIFRDEQHLKVGTDLTKSIRDALEESEFFILLASPEAAESTWVRDEIKIWCDELKRADRADYFCK